MEDGLALSKGVAWITPLAPILNPIALCSSSHGALAIRVIMSRKTLFDKPPDFGSRRVDRVLMLLVHGTQRVGKGGTCEFRKHPPFGVRTDELSAPPRVETGVKVPHSLLGLPFNI
jgi:hypothetical protein